MRYGAIEQFSEALAGSPEKSSRKRRRSRQSADVQTHVARSWFLFVLLAAVIYSVIWCVQLAITSPSMGFLTYVAALGLALGFYTARHPRFPGWLTHSVALALALLLAYWLASGSDSPDTSAPLFTRIVLWFNLLVSGGVSSDNAIFVFFVATLGFLLAYISAWLVYCMHSPWLMVVSNATVLLISLNGTNPALVVFLAIFILASLLLLLRFNLSEWMVRWERQGSRYADDLGFAIMQVGALISVGIIIFSWILPGSYLNPSLSLVWNADNGPVSQVTSAWNRLFAVQSSSNVVNRGNFRENLVLGGNPNLSDEIVFTVKTQAASVPYLAFISYDSYANGQWSITGAQLTDGILPANSALVGPAETHSVQVSITVKNPPDEQHPYIASPFSATSMSVPARLLTDQAGSVIAWLATNGNVPAGKTYTVTSSISSASIDALKTVLLPANAPAYTYDTQIPDEMPSIYAYNPNVIRKYMVLPKRFDARIKSLALITTKNAPTMYEKMDALENFLRSNYQYSLDVNPPPGQDPISWFLFQGKKGFCNYYASAMALMARSLGLPARVVAGYRYGTVEDGVNVIRGKDAHSWPQIYFAGYGWIDFEPTAAFPAFTRPLLDPSSGSTTTTSGQSSAGSTPPSNHRLQDELTGNSSSSVSEQGTASQTSLNQAIVALIGVLILLMLFSALILGLWWRRLFRRYSPVSQIYGRVWMLANLAGVEWQPSQTPYEYLQNLSASVPLASEDSISLEHLGDIYVRERWADPASPEHPLHRDEMKELPRIWQRLRSCLLLYALRHPRFLSWLPILLWRQMVRLWQTICTRRTPEDEF